MKALVLVSSRSNSCLFAMLKEDQGIKMLAAVTEHTIFKHTFKLRI